MPPIESYFQISIMIAAPIARTNPWLAGRGQPLQLVALGSSNQAKPPTPTFKDNGFSTIALQRTSTRITAIKSKHPAIIASAAASGTTLKVGDNVTAVSPHKLLTNDNKEVNLAQLTKDTGVVIFAYPKAATSGCTVQACGFRDNYDGIRDAGFEVYGMSLDEPEAQTSWKIKENLQYSLLTDTDGTALKALGAYKEPHNVVRSHFVIEKGGKILLLENQVKSGESFNQIVDFLATLK